MYHCTRVICRIAFAITAVAFLPVVTANAATNHQRTVLRLHTYGGTPLKTIQVTIGSKPIPFLFDTGGGLTVITPTTAKALGCQPFGQVVGLRASGEKVSYPRCGPVTLRLGAYKVTDEVGVFDLMGMIHGQVEEARKAGYKVSMPPTVGGLIGMSSFAGHAVTLDYAHSRIIVETPASLHKRVASMRPLNVRIVTETSGSKDVFVQVKAKTGTLWVELDSGNNGPTFLALHAIKQLGISLPKGAKASIPLNLAGFGDVQAAVRRRKMIYDSQLGLGLIRKFVWTIDLQNSRAWIKPVF